MLTHVFPSVWIAHTYPVTMKESCIFFFYTDLCFYNFQCHFFSCSLILILHSMQYIIFYAVHVYWIKKIFLHLLIY